MKSKKFPSLPPELEGNERGRLEVQVSTVKVLGCHGHVTVDLCWWGQSECNRIKKSVVYSVVTTRIRFSKYLADAKKLFLRVATDDNRDNDEDGVLGFSLVDNLERLLVGDIFEVLPIVDKDGTAVGSLQISMVYGNGTGAKSESGAANVPKITMKSRPRTATTTATATTKSADRRPLLRPQSSSSLPTTPIKRGSKARTMSNEDICNPRPPPSRAVSFRSDDTSFSADFSQNDTDGLRRILLRSKERLAKFEHQSEDKKPKKPKRQDLVPAEASTTSSGTEDRTAPMAAVPVSVAVGGGGGGLLPQWNLSTTRLRFISSVTELTVCVRYVKLTKSAMEQIGIGSAMSKKVVLRSGRKQQGGLPSARDPVSLFVSYTVPPTAEKIQFCARKVASAAAKSDIVFNQRSTHATLFKPELLDLWWTSEIEFKIHSRPLNQRVPTFIGEASLGMKHLLMDAENSSGKVIKLPIYASQTFSRAQTASKPEIVGDCYVSFALKSPATSGNGRAGSSLSSSTSRLVSPQKAVRDGEVEEDHEYDEVEETSASAIPESAAAAVGERPRIAVPQPTATSKTHRQHFLKNEASATTIFFMIQVSEGRNFTLIDHSSPPSLFVSCRFLSATDVVKSKVAWNTTRPTFNLQHCVPFKLDEDFVRSRCKENYLVLEVWNFVGKSDEENELIGIAMLPLHQFFLSFKDPARSCLVLDADLPIIAVNDWIPVTDLKEGNEKGELKVTLAAGVEAQIAKLVPIQGLREPRKEKTNGREEELVTEDDDEHIYDSVNGDETSEYEEPAPKSCPPPQNKIRVHFSPKEDKEHELSEGLQSMTLLPGRKDEGGEPGPKEKGQDEDATDINVGSYFSAVVSVEEGRNLPSVSDGRGGRLAPSTYLTFASRNPSTVVTDITHRSKRPRWEFKQRVDISSDVLTDPRRHFIMKLWHHRANDDVIDLERDHVIGFIAIDLTPLCLSAFSLITGWYNVMDFVGRCRGQVKVTLTPTEDACLPRTLLRRESQGSSTACCAEEDAVRFVTAGSYARFPSHLIQYTEQMISPSPPLIPPPPDSVQSSNTKKSTTHWEPPTTSCTTLDEATTTYSYLERKLSEMTITTQQVKERLSGGAHMSTSSSGQHNPGHSESPVSVPDPSQLTTDQLQTVIETRLRQMRRQTHMTEEDDVVEEVDLVSSSSSSSGRVTPNLSAVSAEIAGILGMERQDGANTAADMPDLGEIDWTQILRPGGGSESAEAALSRQGPEGGNPAEEDRVGSGRRATTKVEDDDENEAQADS